MNLSTYNNRPKVLLPEKNRLIRQAKSGDTNAFVQLYDSHVERVYRYIHFLVPNNRIAEGLTFQVFFKAWDNFDRYQKFGSTFVMWLYSIAQEQVSAYYRSRKKVIAPDNDFVSAAKGGPFWMEFKTIRNGLQILTAQQQQVLILKFVVGVSNKNMAHLMGSREEDVSILQLHALQALAEHLKVVDLRINMKGFQRILEECLMKLLNGVSTLEECLVRYPDFAAQLNPLLETALLLTLGRNVKPSPIFNAYTHDALNQYVQTRPRQSRIIMPMLRRAALTFAMLVAVLLATGTAHAQSALPGDTFYTWKRTSEQVWRTISLDPVATDIALSERRLNEWIAVAKDQTRSTSAKDGYLEALARLKATKNKETVALIVPALESQQQILNKTGLITPELDDYLIDAISFLPVDVLIQSTPIKVASTITSMPTFTHIVPTATKVPPTATEVPPTATEVPPTATEVPPTATEVPPTATDVPPTATDVPPTATDVPPTATNIPTEIVPTVTPTLPPESTPTDQPLP
jgi:RNA polymerase sigma factor (sigma-70 family)